MSSLHTDSLPHHSSPTSSPPSHADSIGSPASTTTVDSLGPLEVCNTVRRNSSFGGRKYPSLEDILCARALPPFDLPEFLAFAASNHCVEAVEFLIAAANYRKAYYQKTSNKNNNNITGVRDDKIDINNDLWTQWTFIVNTFIHPHGAKEVNLTCQARSSLLQQHTEQWQLKNQLRATNSPNPAALDHACDVVREMVKDNLYLSFVLSRKSGATAVTVAPSINKADRRNRVSDSSIASIVDEEVEQDLVTGQQQQKSQYQIVHISHNSSTNVGEQNKPVFSMTNSRSSSFSSSINDTSSNCAISSSGDESAPPLVSRPSWTRKLSMRFKRRS